MSDETDFSPGDVVVDGDAIAERQNPAVVVNCIPGATADEWTVPGGHTVADDNPDYPSDASVIAVVYETTLEGATLDWNREEPIPFTELNDAGLHYYAFPVSRLMGDSERPSAAVSADTPATAVESHSDESPTPALTDIQHVGESRADDLRETGYESVTDVARADQSGLSEVEGIGNTRAGQITESATDLLGELSDGSEPTETDTDTPESREAPATDTAPSAAIVALSRFLNRDGMEAEIADDGQSVRVRQADESYRVNLTEGVEGDGPHRSHLEEAVKKVRAVTEVPTSKRALTASMPLDDPEA